MIFICIFVTISLSFCNSVFIKRTSNTHLLVLSYVEMDAFKGNLTLLIQSLSIILF